MSARALYLSLAIASLSGCRGCGDDSASTAPAPSASADSKRAPYLPARSANDNSPAPMSEVEAVLFTLRPQLNACYRAAAAANPKLSGDALFHVTIDPRGKVKDVSLTSQNGLDPGVVACATEALRGASFRPPPDAGAAMVNVPIAFRPPS